MSLINELIKDFLRKKGKLVTEMGIFDEFPEHLKVENDIRFALMLWNISTMQGVVYKKLAKQVGWDKIQEASQEAFFEQIDEILTSDDMKPALGFLKKTGGKSQALNTFKNIVTLYDYILGNYDEFTEVSPNKLLGKNKHCSTFNFIKDAGLVGKVSCAPSCFYGMKKVAALIDPKLKITGNRDGKEIGVPSVRFNKNRNAGDDHCECEIVLEE